jgi:quercetin dioxygenase-like cupin family protein
MSAVHRRRGDGAWRWEGVGLEEYPRASGAVATKQVLIGPADGAGNFALRYFEIAPGGTSAFDTHAHDHGVFVLCGHGMVRLGEEQHAIAAGDVVYVSPNEVHQFKNPGPEVLGFLCVVPSASIA